MVYWEINIIKEEMICKAKILYFELFFNLRIK